MGTTEIEKGWRKVRREAMKAEAAGDTERAEALWMQLRAMEPVQPPVRITSIWDLPVAKRMCRADAIENNDHMKDT